MVTSFKAKKNPIKLYAQTNGLSCTDWILFNSDECKIRYDVGVVVSFGQMIPENVINLFPL